MSEHSDDSIRKIFGKSAKDVLQTELYSFKPVAWKELKTDDDCRGLFAYVRVKSLVEASNRASLFINELKQYSSETNKSSHMSLSSEGIAIVLYGASKKEFTEDDWVMARQLAKVLGF